MEQRLSNALVDALGIVCSAAHCHITRADGNPGERSKKKDFWDEFGAKSIALPPLWEEELAESAFETPTDEEDAIAAEWEKVRRLFLNDNRTIQALEAYTNREWVAKYRRKPVASLAANDWKTLKKMPGLGTKKLKALAEMFAIAAVDLAR